jgi:oligosaccharide repeat unit polymerase
MPVRVKWVVHLAVLSPVGVAFLYGGRSPIVFVCALVVGAMIVRSLKGERALPYSRRGVAVILLVACAVVLYIHYIFTERLLTQGVTRYEDLVRRFEAVYNATPSPVIEEWLMPYVSPAVLMTLLNTHLYFTHEFFVLDLTLTYDGKIGPYFGHYQFYLLSAFIERFVPSLSFAEPIRSEAQAAGVFGWFSTAWGGMYLDFGYVGGLVATFVCGYVSASVFRDAVRRHRLAAELIACYVAGGILISPILSPFTVSISLPILTSILGSAWLITRAQRANSFPWASSAARRAHLGHPTNMGPPRTAFRHPGG